MSGNPDVLEYYRNSHAKKPIRTIDLNECEVLRHSGPNFIRKEFQNNFVFIVRTTYRTFYLVAKTEEEMQAWVHNISQICNFGHLEDGTEPSFPSPVGSMAMKGIERMLGPSVWGRGDALGRLIRNRDWRELENKIDIY
ncbi:hypothetical protein HGM15179_021488 [Zosterops borbonicus]|uniref:PH domain-containing protein n=1 Tax=Zosterops borbonicus TaxID=364589 RepID=A0A8K1FTZ7_9PASS|nr:hypothetical protein HGM15179_021488 [Zosterops borbonicus]